MREEQPITVLTVYQNTSNAQGNPNRMILGTEADVSYRIARYQRPFSWGEGTKQGNYPQIEQLIEDIKNIRNTQEHYYLGALVVKKEEEKGKTVYEVIDGQQRLTALYLLLAALGEKNLPNITYQQRKKAETTLRNIKEGKEGEAEEELAEIRDGFNRIKSLVAQLDKAGFQEKLAKVRLFRVPVPSDYKGTDLNRYFEVMNTRGKQLEQADIVKANLMSPLDEKARLLFADIWYACLRMNGYVQENMTNRARKALFEDANGTLKDNITFDTALESFKEDNEKQPKSNSYEGTFFSLIPFPYFLLHVLKIYTKSEKTSMDDKCLAKTFNPYKGDASFSKGFILYLLKCRCQMDTYLIKREKKEEENETDWSLKKYVQKYVLVKKEKKRKREKEKQIEIKNTFGDKAPDSQEKILMLQAGLQVTFNSYGASWITDTLKYLYDKQTALDADGFEQKLESYFKEYDTLQNFVWGNDYTKGTGTPHVAFHYLDYLLWKERKGRKKDDENTPQISYDDFKFQYRNSVEHLYPQHFGQGKEGLNHFGNLCLLTKSLNSTASDHLPDQKFAFLFKNTNQSMKLRYMQAAFNAQKDADKNEQWINETYKKHGEEMLKKLKSALANSNPPPIQQTENPSVENPQTPQTGNQQPS